MPKINYLNFYLNPGKEKQVKRKVSWRKEITEIRVEINEMQYGQTNKQKQL